MTILEKGGAEIILKKDILAIKKNSGGTFKLRILYLFYLCCFRFTNIGRVIGRLCI